MHLTDNNHKIFLCYPLSGSVIRFPKLSGTRLASFPDDPALEFSSESFIYFVSPSKSSFWKKMPLLEVQWRVNKTEIKQSIHSIDVKGYVDYR